MTNVTYSAFKDMSETDQTSNFEKLPASRHLREEQEVEQLLREIVRDTVQEGVPDLKQLDINVPLNLKVTVGFREHGELRFEPDLRTQILEQVEKWSQPLESYQPGAVYDYFEQSSEAKDCRPPTARSVFEGYDAKGHPTWMSFDEWRETGLGQSGLTVRLQAGNELRQRQLEAYGKNSRQYHILGQACVGYLPLPPEMEAVAEDDRLALTLQVVEICDDRDHYDVVLNLLAGRLMPEEVDALLAEPSCQPVLRALSKLEEELFRLRDRASRAWHERNSEALRQVLQRIPGLLTRFSRSITVEPVAPREIPYPVVDILVANLRDLCYDRERDAWVLLGSKETGYVFDGDGRLLSSFQASENRVDLRLSSGRWREAVEQEQPVLDLLKLRAKELTETKEAQSPLT